MDQEITIRNAYLTDSDELAELRMRAMEPSLRVFGRFDPQRARKRFLDTFIAENTFLAIKKNRIIGFYMITESQDIKLNHLYIYPDFQNLGLGKHFVNKIKEIAILKTNNIILETLKESPANDFYISQGFIKIGELEYDNIYCWTPAHPVF